LKVFLGWALRLNIANDMLLTIPDTEVGISCLGLLRKGGDVNLGLSPGFGKSLKEAFEARIVALLAGIAPLCYLRDAVQILSQHVGLLSV